MDSATPTAQAAAQVCRMRRQRCPSSAPAALNQASPNVLVTSPRKPPVRRSSSCDSHELDRGTAGRRGHKAITSTAT